MDHDTLEHYIRDATAKDYGFALPNSPDHYSERVLKSLHQQRLQRGTDRTAASKRQFRMWQNKQTGNPAPGNA